MDIHEDARTTHHSRLLMIKRLQADWSVGAVATALGITSKTVRKWRHRHAVEGIPGLADRSSRPHRSPTRLAGYEEEAIEALRRQRLTAPAIARRLAGRCLPSASCCAGAGWAGWPPWTRGRPSPATNASGQAS